MADEPRFRFGDIDLTGAVTAAPYERTIEGASTQTLTVRDPDRKLLAQLEFDEETQKLREHDPLVAGGDRFALVKVAKTGGDFDWVFEDTAVAALRKADAVRKARRGDVTRAQFVRALVESVRPRVPFFAPELNMPQPKQDRPKREQREIERAGKNPGFDRGARLAIKGRRADQEQRRILEIAMAESDDLNAPHDARKALVIGLIQESSVRDLDYSGDGLSEGALQLTYATARALGMSQHDEPAIIREFLRNGFAKYRPTGAIEMARQPGLSAAEIAVRCLNPNSSVAPYARWADEAEAIIAAWGGGATSGERGGSVTYEKDYYFTVGRPHGPRGENYWDASGRMAEEVGRRRFVVDGEFWWISEEDLFARPVGLTISENTAGIESIDFDIDNGKRVKECTVECQLDGWEGSPGGIVEIEKLGPAGGKWLIVTIEGDRFSPHATVTLRKPIREKPEPRGELVTRTVQAQEAADAGGDGDPGANKNFKGSRSTFAWPTASHPVTSGFGPRGGRLHAGVDIGVPVGTDVKAAAAGGSVGILSDPGGYGTYLVVQHGNGWETRYAHLSKVLVKRGADVAKGQLIAKSGGAPGAPGAGNSRGPHLHFEVRRNGVPVNPASYLP